MARAAIQHQSRRASQRKLEIEQVRLALDTPQYRVAVRDEYAQLQATLSDMQAAGYPALKFGDTFAAAVKRAVQQTCQRCAGRALSRVGPEPSELILSFALDDALAQIASRKKDATRQRQSYLTSHYASGWLRSAHYRLPHDQYRSSLLSQSQS